MVLSMPLIVWSTASLPLCCTDRQLCPAGILWTGHNDGRVCAFALDAKPGVALTGRMLNSWQAHRIGSVTVLITTPWGELWSGSSRGIIRVWRHAHKPQGGGHRCKQHLCMAEHCCAAELLCMLRCRCCAEPLLHSCALVRD